MPRSLASPSSSQQHLGLRALSSPALHSVRGHSVDGVGELLSNKILELAESLFTLRKRKNLQRLAPSHPQNGRQQLRANAEAVGGPVVGVDIHPPKLGQMPQLQRGLFPQWMPMMASAVLLVHNADHPDIIGLHDQGLNVSVSDFGGHCRVHGLVDTFPRVVGRLLLRIGQHRVGHTDGRKLYGARAAVGVLVRVHFKGQLLVRSLDLGVRGPR
mmetsp:Transcript_42784/g.93385  ORF Transcript_42784/g.93385 Transcript_42784/m.93385 type:complete len:214 (+) Transcript_42784:1162-1803(+)